MNDERREYDVVDKYYSEQHICQFNNHTLIVRKTGALAPVELSFTSVRSAGCQTKNYIILEITVI